MVSINYEVVGPKKKKRTVRYDDELKVPSCLISNGWCKIFSSSLSLSLFPYIHTYTTVFNRHQYERMSFSLFSKRFHLWPAYSSWLLEISGIFPRLFFCKVLYIFFFVFIVCLIFFFICDLFIIYGRRQSIELCRVISPFRRRHPLLLSLPFFSFFFFVHFHFFFFFFIFRDF